MKKPHNGTFRANEKDWTPTIVPFEKKVLLDKGQRSNTSHKQSINPYETAIQIGLYNIHMRRWILFNLLGQYHAISLDRNYFSCTVYRCQLKHFPFRWLNIFPREQILTIDGESFVKNPLNALVQIETFLGIKHWFSHTMFVRNPNKPAFFCFKATGNYAPKVRRKCATSERLSVCLHLQFFLRYP